MRSPRRQFGLSLLITTVILAALLLLAWNGTTWAAPGAQGTVPTPRVTDASGNDQATAVPDDNQNPNEPTDNSGGGDNSGLVPLVPESAPPTTGSVCAVSDDGTQCTVDPLLFVLSPGAMPAGSALAIEGSFTQPPCPPSGSDVIFVNHCYRLTWLGADTQILAAFNAPVTTCISYNSADLGLAANRADTFLVGFARADGAWSIIKPTLDEGNSRVCATVDQVFTWLGLFAPPSIAASPTTGTATSADPLALPLLGSWVQTWQAWAQQVYLAIQNQ